MKQVKGKELEKHFSGYKLNKKFTIVILLVLGICLSFFMVNTIYGWPTGVWARLILP